MPGNDIPSPISDTTRSIGVLLIDGFALMSYAALIEPFRAANILAGSTLYSWTHHSLDGGPATASNGVALIVDRALGEGPDPDMVLVIAGGDPSRFDHPGAYAWLRRLERNGAVLVGTSGGPFLLARAGLLDGYRATIHWEHQPAFREAFPDVDLCPTLYVIDRRRVTCAGGSAGTDLAVELIARDHGRLLASRVAEWFIRTEVREASGRQRTFATTHYGVSQAPLARALTHMEQVLDEPLCRDAVARVAGVSARQLERLFAIHIGSTPGRVHLSMRLDRAGHLVRSSDLSIMEIAAATGFQSRSHFSRVFRAHHGQSPKIMRHAHWR